MSLWVSNSSFKMEHDNKVESKGECIIKFDCDVHIFTELFLKKQGHKSMSTLSSQHFIIYLQ